MYVSNKLKQFIYGGAFQSPLKQTPFGDGTGYCAILHPAQDPQFSIHSYREYVHIINARHIHRFGIALVRSLAKVNILTIST